MKRGKWRPFKRVLYKSIIRKRGGVVCYSIFEEPGKLKRFGHQADKNLLVQYNKKGGVKINNIYIDGRPSPNLTTHPTMPIQARFNVLSLPLKTDKFFSIRVWQN
jgi:hypothetical protein